MGPLLALAAACIDPIAFGAIPDDGKPDNQAIQQAVEAAEAQGGGAEICFPAGTFDLGPPVRLASVWIRKGGFTIRGVDDRTVLRMSGDPHGATWYGLFLYGAAHVTLRDFTITATATTDTQEQTHLIQIGPGASDIHVNTMRLGPMRRPDQAIGDGAGGDCIRLLGERDSMVEDVEITDDDFIGCDRSGITVQRGIRRLTISKDAFALIGDTPIDFEPTATAPIADVSMTDLAITRSPHAQGAWAITIAGFGMTNPTRHVTVSDCDLIGGGIGLLNTLDVTIKDNRITHGTGVGDTIKAMRSVVDLHIEHNTITRPSSSPPGAVIGMSHNNGGIPAHIHVVDNDLVQNTAYPVIDDTSASSVEVRDNRITYGGSTPAFAVAVNAVAAQIDDVVLDGNEIHGAVAGVVKLAAERASIGRVSLSGNRSSDAPIGVQCEASKGTFRAPVFETDDHFDRAQSSCVALTPVPARRSSP